MKMMKWGGFKGSRMDGWMDGWVGWDVKGMERNRKRGRARYDWDLQRA